MRTRTDPRCPSCDGKISATATYCLHCGADIDDRERGRTQSDVEPITDSLESPHRTARSGRTAAELVGTVAIAFCAATFVATGLFFFVGIITQSALVALVVLPFAFGGTAVLVWRGETAADSLAVGCYCVAFTLVLVPFLSLAPSIAGESPGGAVVLFVLWELVFGAVALVVAGIGYWVVDAGSESASSSP